MSNIVAPILRENNKKHQTNNNTANFNKEARNNSPSTSSHPKITALQLTTVIENAKGCNLKFELIRAGTTPILDNPSHRPINSNFDSINIAISSPLRNPSVAKQLATWLL